MCSSDLTNYYTELVNTLGGFLVGKTDEFRPYVDADKKLRFVDPTKPWEAEGMPRIESSIEGISMKAYIGLYSFAFLPSGFDPGWQDAMFMCVEGSGNCYDIDEEDPFGGNDQIEVASFVDPWSMKTYLAKNTNYASNRLNPAFWLVNRANDVKTAWEALDDDDPAKAGLEVELRDIVENMDMILTFNELYGDMTY